MFLIQKRADKNWIFGTKGSVNWPENKYHIVKNNKITKKSFPIQKTLASNTNLWLL